MENDLLIQYRKTIKKNIYKLEYPSVSHFLKTCEKLDIPIFLMYEDTKKEKVSRTGYAFNQNTCAFLNFLENSLPLSAIGYEMRNNKNIENGNFRFYYLTDFEIIYFHVKFMEDCFFIRSKRILR